MSTMVQMAGCPHGGSGAFCLLCAFPDLELVGLDDSGTVQVRQRTGDDTGAAPGSLEVRRYWNGEEWITEVTHHPPS